MSALTTTPDPGRPIYKRWTIIAGFIVLSVKYAEDNGIIPPGMGTQFADLIQAGAVLLGGAGLYRHLPTT